ncbi:hypothetical protein QBC35DRAFT_456673 [Podospora australis]|uniref:Uncharacterized protein n=1 Tax=Podospora australis TaxID=1536484 RepID=A0AAN7AEJ7_9PEZI|nr:hypothetical protein QBC35DRAFT_456673 [Podospora australis]
MQSQLPLPLPGVPLVSVITSGLVDLVLASPYYHPTGCVSDKDGRIRWNYHSHRQTCHGLRSPQDIMAFDPYDIIVSVSWLLNPYGWSPGRDWSCRVYHCAWFLTTLLLGLEWWWMLGMDEVTDGLDNELAGALVLVYFWLWMASIKHPREFTCEYWDYYVRKRLGELELEDALREAGAGVDEE